MLLYTETEIPPLRFCVLFHAFLCPFLFAFAHVAQENYEKHYKVIAPEKPLL